MNSHEVATFSTAKYRMFIQTTATKKLLKLKKRIRGIAGGTSASKTVSILLILLDKAQSSNKSITISVVSETMPHLKRGAIRDFLEIMQKHKYFNPSKWNKTDFIYDFSDKKNKRIIEFFSADQPGKVRGPRRDVLFINEANNISYETFTQLEIRTRETIWLDWNPVTEFWFYEGEDDGKGSKHQAVKDREDTDFMILTYKDNEALEQSIINTIESRKEHRNWWKVYGQGLLGESEGRIYKGWTQLDKVPEEARLKRKGLDFGYTNDPAGIVDIYIWNNAFIWDEILYKKGMSNKDLSDAILQTDNTLTIADSAEPKSIDELISYGISVLPSQKGPGSVNQGIQWVQDQTIYVTKRSVNIWKEYRNYLWITDKEGKTINTPQDYKNHLMDAGRYAMESLKPYEDDLTDIPDDMSKLEGLY